ncbi:hypothetical protein PHMEG_00028613 [Phytophthora megakarya]|uniref:Uncharacterized protein n=1 Tax=Phytophthora megakarya TaxID=4795 RepID=A0A225V4I6_9STRA|nr:hypothetical protein PHMEG_00028613 [Phytophthora megakarya]
MLSPSLMPTSGSAARACSNGSIAARKRYGLRGQPWYTPRRCRIGAVVAASTGPSTTNDESW